MEERQNPLENPVIISLGVYLVVLGTILIYFTFIAWPPDVEYARGQVTAELAKTQTSIDEAKAKTGSETASAKDFPCDLVILGFVRVPMTYDERVVLMVIVIGALGSYIHVVTSFADYVGNRRFVDSWVLWYILRPFTGAPTAFLFYLIVRAGFFTGSATAADINRFGIGAVAGLAGMFSLKAADKMKEVFDTMFKTDEKRTDTLENPVPVVEALKPNSINAGKATDVSIDGSGFTQKSTVELDGAVCASEFKSAQELILKVGADRFPKEASVKVVVKNPSPGGGESTPAVLTIMPPE